MKLGELRRIDLRVAWQREESDFTPWMEDRIDLLAKTLGLEGDLEVESREEPVGRYRADLICSSQAGRVLVENQLGETDHSHLGQVLAYASGVEATVVVWVAASFTEEHRAAIDWLNSITGGVDFFGLEIELWQIGDSDPALQSASTECRKFSRPESGILSPSRRATTTAGAIERTG